MTSREVLVFGCPCCRLQRPPAVERSTGVSARVCAACTHHQGDQDSVRLRRAEAHERMLRERMDASRKSEAKAQSAALQADKRASEIHEQMKAALSTRSISARRTRGHSARGSRSLSSMPVRLDGDSVAAQRASSAREHGGDIRAWAKSPGHPGQRPRARPCERCQYEAATR